MRVTTILDKPLDSMVIAYEKRIEEQEQRIAELEATLRDYLEAHNHKYLAVRDERNQAEEDATLEVERLEKRLPTLVYS